MTIRPSSIADIDTLLRLADEAKAIMRRSGNTRQWNDGYPSAEVFENDIRREVSYIVEADGKAVATFAAVPSPEPTYDKIYDGQWIDDVKPYLVVHRIASSAEIHGVMNEILNFCFNRIDNVRIDTHRDNVIMRHLMEKHGFDYCGIIYLANGDERLAFQKTIKKHI